MHHRPFVGVGALPLHSVRARIGRLLPGRRRYGRRAPRARAGAAVCSETSCDNGLHERRQRSRFGRRGRDMSRLGALRLCDGGDDVCPTVELLGRGRLVLGRGRSDECSGGRVGQLRGWGIVVDCEVSRNLGNLAELRLGSGRDGVDVRAGGEKAAVNLDFAV